MSKRRVLILASVLVLYLGSYLALSRRGYAFADRMCVRDGFWFFEPQPTAGWEIAHYGCTFFYAPLIFIDQHCFGGRRPANVPLFGLSR